jgi:hypothetical protein
MNSKPNLNPNLSNFLNKQNLNLLWDVLLDELHIDSNNKQIVSNIKTVFESNINPFIKNVNINNAQLVNLNKQFLSQVVIAVNRLFPNLKQEQEFKRIQISSEEIEDPYKIEDIREARQDNFEKQLQLKRVEFENSITVHKPKELDFTEKIEDGKIKEMDTLIAETVARRNFDIEQINKNNYVSVEDPENWLQPQKITKNSEINNANNNTNNNTNNNNKKEEKEQINNDLGIYRKLKLKQIDPIVKTEIITTPKKNVTWNDEKQVNNMSLLIEEMSLSNNNMLDKDQLLINKFDKLINQMEILTEKINSMMNIIIEGKQPIS